MAFKTPQTKPTSKVTSRPKSKPASQSSPLEDDSLEGKLLDEIEFGLPKKQKSTTSTTLAGGKAKPKANRKTPLEFKKPNTTTVRRGVKLPSLPPSSPPSTSDNDNDANVQQEPKPRSEKIIASSTSKGVKKVVKSNGSFDMDAILNTTRSKPQVVYKAKPKSKESSEDEKDECGSIDDLESVSSSKGDEEEEKEEEKVNDEKKSKVKEASRKPIVELVTKKSSSQSLAALDEHDDEKHDNGDADIDMDVDIEKSAVIETDQTISKLTEPTLDTNPSAQVTESRPSRVSKTRGVKRLAEYNLDEIDASDGGSAGVVLDDMMPPPTTKSSSNKKSRKSDTAPTSTAIHRFMEKSEASVVEDGIPYTETPVVGSTDVVDVSANVESVVSKAKAPNTKSTKVKPEKTPTRSVVSTKKQKALPPSSPPELDTDIQSPTYDKGLILKMVIAKLEGSKNILTGERLV